MNSKKDSLVALKTALFTTPMRCLYVAVGGLALLGTVRDALRGDSSWGMLIVSCSIGVALLVIGLLDPAYFGPSPDPSIPVHVDANPRCVKDKWAWTRASRRIEQDKAHDEVTRIINCRFQRSMAPQDIWGKEMSEIVAYIIHRLEALGTPPPDNLMERVIKLDSASLMSQNYAKSMSHGIVAIIELTHREHKTAKT